jgi:hypothetical protein
MAWRPPGSKQPPISADLHGKFVKIRADLRLNIFAGGMPAVAGQAYI